MAAHRHSYIGLTINHLGEAWVVIGVGADTVIDGEHHYHCHLKSTTRGRQQANGWVPAQIGDWIPISYLADEHEAAHLDRQVNSTD